MEEYANVDNEYLQNWKVRDSRTGLPVDVSPTYFVFPDEIDIFYDSGQIISSNQPNYTETPIHIFPKNLSEIKVEEPWLDPENKNNSMGLGQLEENNHDSEDESDNPNKETEIEELDEEFCYDFYLKQISVALTVVFIVLLVAIWILIQRVMKYTKKQKQLVLFTEDYGAQSYKA